MGGILCESKVKGDELNQVVIGVGINVNETKDDFDDRLQATSMKIYSGTVSYTHLTLPTKA